MRFTAKLAPLLLLAILPACAQRTLTINSEPQGALVYLNNEEIGRTPVVHDFLWYADYDVTLRMDGYETLTTHRKLNAPVYMWPPLDLFSELFGVKDRREWTFNLTAATTQPADPQTIIARAQELKGELRSSKYTRTPTTRPTTEPK